MDGQTERRTDGRTQPHRVDLSMKSFFATQTWETSFLTGKLMALNGKQHFQLMSRLFSISTFSVFTFLSADETGPTVLRFFYFIRTILFKF